MAQNQFDSFPKADKFAWKDAAKKELGGRVPFETLTSSKESLQIGPYYDASDTEGLPEDILKPSSDPYLGPRGWYNTPNVNVSHSETANKIALAHLDKGADGILFRIKSPIQIEKLLSDIELPYCSTLCLIEGEHPNLLDEFEQYVNAKGFDKTQIVGGVFWESSLNGKSKLINQFEGWGKFHVLGNIVSPKTDPTIEIANALLTGANMVSEIIDEGVDPKNVFSHMAFSFSISTDFFMEIAKLKTFRRLWRQVASSYKASSKSDSLFLHGVSSYWKNDAYGPNANMLKSTTASLSAVLGGCDAITVESEEENGEFKSRIARNVLTLLREESHLNQTSDPTAGSYFLESLIDQMAKSAWGKFQKGIQL